MKLLGNGTLAKKLDIALDAVSESARAKVEGAGGSVEILATNARQKRAQAEAARA